MELGNAVFGNSRGEYPVPRHWERAIYRLFDVTDLDPYTEYENDTFWIFPYYWGDCTCGWDDLDGSHRRIHALEHRENCFHTKYLEIERSTKCNDWRKSHDRLLKVVKELYKERGWDTESKNWWHGIAARCDCDFYERQEAIYQEYAHEFGHNGHRPDCLLLKDNFRYKPTGFAIQWYKYPLRDSYMNQKINLREFHGIIEECIKSVREAE